MALALALLAGYNVCAQTAPAPSLDAGIKFYLARKYTDALLFFQQAARQYPDDPDVHYYLAVCYHCLRMTPQAEQQYNWILMCAPDSHAAGLAKTGLKNLKSGPPMQPVPAGGKGQSLPQPPGEGTQPDAAAAPQWPDWSQIGQQKHASIASTGQSYIKNQPSRPAATGMYGRMKVLEFYADW